MSPNPNTNAVGPEVVTEERWIIVWPNGEVYSTHERRDWADDSFRDLTTTLEGYGVPAEYWPTIKRRRRTVTKSAWEELPNV